jgi:hypothetical protein
VAEVDGIAEQLSSGAGSVNNFCLAGGIHGFDIQEPDGMVL